MVYDANESGEYYGVRLKLNFNEKFWLSVNGLWNDIGNANYKSYWGALGFKFLGGLELKGAYYFQDISDDTVAALGLTSDDPKARRVILDVNQDVLKFTSLWVEYNDYDRDFMMENVPWSFNNRADFDYSGSGNFDYLAVPDDMTLLGIGAKQKWNEKWSTFERFAKYDVDNFGDIKEWTVGVGYQYSPNLYFELAYNKLDGDAGILGGIDDFDSKQIRFRTLMNF